MRRKVSIALSFLTVIPVNVGVFQNQREFSDAAVYFPLVGGFLGSIFAIISFYALGRLSPGPIIVLLFIASFLLTKGLHVDGLADTADGLLGSTKRERALAIMRDSAVGPMGAAAVFLLYLLKYAAMSTLALQFILPPVFFYMPVCGRWSMVLAGAFFPPAREGGLGYQFINGLGKGHFLKASLWGAILLGAAFLFPATDLIFPVLSGVIAALAIALLLSFFAAQSLGGITGDILGAVNEVAEASFLLGVLLWVG